MFLEPLQNSSNNTHYLHSLPTILTSMSTTNDNSIPINNRSAFSTCHKEDEINTNNGFMNPPSLPTSPKINANNSSKFIL